MSEHLQKMADGVLVALKAFGKSLEGLRGRLELVEKRQPEKGERGAPGDKGADGNNGSNGEKGDRGDQGEKGEKGDAGGKGDKGDPGEPGKPGDRGEPGAKGEQGTPGEKGTPGVDGKDGAAGAPGEKGDHGDRGAKGEPGPPGESIKGDRGEKGDPGQVGEKGDPGEVGRDGQKGTPGRDALHLEILPRIDESKSYQRCTFAAHRGGLWRSFETTQGMKGWECVVDGDAEDVIEQGDDLRTFTFRKVKSSGRIVEMKAVLPVVLYREIWTERDYAAGDSVTRDGCLWIAVSPATLADVPGKSEVWKMSVRKGRDGTHGLRGEKGDRGATGRDWGVQ